MTAGRARVWQDGVVIGFVQRHPIDGRVWWRSWLPTKVHVFGRGPVGLHQDRAQAERFLRQLARAMAARPLP